MRSSDDFQVVGVNKSAVSFVATAHQCISWNYSLVHSNPILLFYTETIIQYHVRMCPTNSRSQPRGLRQELSSLAKTLGSWVRIPFKAWMSGVYMRLFCVCVVLCLGRGFAMS
jgi:hypothetical protein